MKQLIYTMLVTVFVAATSMTTFAQESKNINVSISEKDGLKKVTIKKTLEDGTIDVINWEGTGEIPAEIKKEIEESGKFSIHTLDGDFKFYSKDDLTIGGPHKIMIIKDKEGVDGLKEEIEIIMEQSLEDGVIMNKTKDVQVIHLNENGKIEDEELKKELKIILEDVKEGAIIEAVEDIKVIRIDQDGEIKLDEEDLDLDMDIQIHKIDNEAGEQEVEIIIENGEGSVSNRHKIVVIKRIEENSDDNTPETVNQASIEKAPQVLERNLNLSDFQISPNPAADKVNLSFQGASVPTTIRLLSLDGKQLYKEFIRDFGGSYQNDIDIRDIRANFLIVNIEQNGKVYSEKLAVKK